MATSKVLSTPTILGIEGSTLKIKHPDISSYPLTSITTPFTAAGTTLAVRDNNGFADDDFFILGEIGNAKTEECDVNGTVTRGASLTITNSTKFSHELDTPVTRIVERGIRIYGAATDGGSGTLLASVDAITTPIADATPIKWDKPYTSYTIISTDTSYNYYYVVFTDGTTNSSASDYVLAAGLGNTSGQSLIEAGLKKVNADVDGNLISWEWLLTIVNDFQDYVTNYIGQDGRVKDWPFELFEDVTSVTVAQNENAYAVSSFSSDLKYPDSKQGIIQVRVGTDELKPIDLDEYERLMNGKVRTEVATQAATGATSLVLDDTSELADSGELYLGTQSAVVTYTAKDDDTNTVSGIPSSGTGSITATATVDTVVWQNIAPAIPSKYTIFNGEVLLDVPPDEDTAGKKLKIKAFGALTRLSSLADSTVIPFAQISKYYIASEIEYRKKNTENGDRLMVQFKEELEKAARRYYSDSPESTNYYEFYTHPRL